MIDKSSTDGMKLYSGGKEVTKEQVEQAIIDYEQRKNSIEYQEDMKKIGALFDNPAKKNIKYYRLSFSPYTTFKVDYDNFTSYKLDEGLQSWVEFPVFFTDLENGNIRVSEVQISDEYPTIDAVDQRKGMLL